MLSVGPMLRVDRCCNEGSRVTVAFSSSEEAYIQEKTGLVAGLGRGGLLWHMTVTQGVEGGVWG